MHDLREIEWITLQVSDREYPNINLWGGLCEKFWGEKGGGVCISWTKEMTMMERGISYFKVSNAKGSVGNKMT